MILERENLEPQFAFSSRSLHETRFRAHLRVSLVLLLQRETTYKVILNACICIFTMKLVFFSENYDLYA